MEIILNDGIVENLQELMKNSKWTDYSCDEPICCHSSRFCEGKIDGLEYGVCEIHKCGPDRLARILVRRNKINILEYKIKTSYYRDPHSCTTYLRTNE